MRRRSAFALLAALALGGCAQIPTLDKPVSMKPVDQYQTEQSLAGPSAAWPKDAWWRAYGDVQLDALIDEGLRDSPNMAIAQARLRRAMAVTQVTDSASQPQLDASVSPTLQKQSYNYLFPRSSVPQGWNDYGVASLNFNWEIDFWGKNKAALAAATSLQEAGAADVAQARLTLAASIASSYGDLARLYALRDTALDAARVRAKTLELTRNRYKNGMDTMGSVRQAEARKAAAEADVLTLEEQISLQRNRIAALVGAGPDRGLRINRPTLNVARSFGLPQQLKLELLGRRPDIVAARLRAEAGEKSVERQKTEFYPNVNLGAMVGLQSLGLNNLVKSGSSYGSVGPAISLPILNGGRLEGQLREVQAQQDEAIASYNQTVTQALQEVSDAAISQKSLALQIGKLQQAVKAADEGYRIVRTRYEGGLTNYIDVLSAEEALISSRRALSDTQSRSFTLDVALIKALGGGYQMPEKNSK